MNPRVSPHEIVLRRLAWFLHNRSNHLYREQRYYAAIALASRRIVNTVMSSSCPKAFAASAI